MKVTPLSTRICSEPHVTLCGGEAGGFGCFRKGGFAAQDVQIVRTGETAGLMVTRSPGASILGAAREPAFYSSCQSVWK